MIKKAKDLVNLCIKNNITISAAESCTGGMFSSSIVSVPKSSAIFKFGLVTYSNVSKIKFLNIPNSILLNYGAVSKETAKLMVNNLLDLSKSNFCIAITGIAGPSGGTKIKPVGLVYHGFLFKGQKPIIIKKIYGGSRNVIRKSATIFCLEKSFSIIHSFV